MTHSGAKTSYDTIVAQCLKDADVSLGKMLNAQSLRVKGKSFAYLGTDGLVVKLPASDVSDLERRDLGKRLVVGKRVMKEWLVVSNAHFDMWSELVAQAQAFVGR
ncbi:hypothetical protein AADZ90_019900 [Aestuariibius sp. 2305UL40-4]|uniref:hypothetical protein n=1 Tax=Aestuariibius violaceus TaxID=3234132 RepID=UPI00347A7A7D